jgi:hypothetical protein
MKVKLWCCTHDLQSEAEEIIEVDDDTTPAELNLLAEDFFWNEKEPEWGYEVVE